MLLSFSNLELYYLFNIIIIIAIILISLIATHISNQYINISKKTLEMVLNIVTIVLNLSCLVAFIYMVRKSKNNNISLMNFLKIRKPLYYYSIIITLVINLLIGIMNIIFLSFDKTKKTQLTATDTTDVIDVDDYSLILLLVWYIFLFIMNIIMKRRKLNNNTNKNTYGNNDTNDDDDSSGDDDSN